MLPPVSSSSSSPPHHNFFSRAKKGGLARQEKKSPPPSAFKPVQRLEPHNLKLPNPKRAWLNGVKKWTILAEFGVVRALGGVEGPRLM